MAYTPEQLQQMWNDPYAESRFRGPVFGESAVDPVTGQVAGVQDPQSYGQMDDSVRKRGWAWGKKKRRWNENYGDWYDPKTGQLMTPDQFAAYHGYPDEVPPTTSDEVPPVSVNHPDFSRQHPLHPANRDIAAPDPLESLVAGDPRAGMAPGSLPGVPVDHPNASPMGQSADIAAPEPAPRTGYHEPSGYYYHEMDEQQLQIVANSGDPQAQAVLNHRQGKTQTGPIGRHPGTDPAEVAAAEQQAARVATENAALDANQTAAWQQQAADPGFSDSTTPDAWTQAQQEGLQSELPVPKPATPYDGFTTQELVEMYGRDPSPELAEALQDREDLDAAIEAAPSYISSGNKEGIQICLLYTSPSPRDS